MRTQSSIVSNIHQALDNCHPNIEGLFLARLVRDGVYQGFSISLLIIEEHAASWLKFDQSREISDD